MNSPNASAGSAGLIKYPCAWSQSSDLMTASCSSSSTHSAVTLYAQIVGHHYYRLGHRPVFRVAIDVSDERPIQLQVS